MRTEVDDDSAIKSGLLGNEQDKEDAILKAYDRYAKPLASYVRERVAPTLDSDELATVVSDAFCGLARRAWEGRFTTNGSLTTLLFRMVRFKAIDILRRKSAKRRKVDLQRLCPDSEEEFDSDSLVDEEFTIRVAQKLSEAPEIAAVWRTAVDEAAASEIMRQFRMLVPNLPRLQRKVAEAIALHCGDVTDAEIADEIAKSGLRPEVASVKSARREIGEKFRALIERKERIKTP